jgi:hypothetical protein
LDAPDVVKSVNDSKQRLAKLALNIVNNFAVTKESLQDAHMAINNIGQQYSLNLIHKGKRLRAKDLNYEHLSPRFWCDHARKEK